MSNQVTNNKAKAPKRERKFLLSNLFVDAEIRIEPEEKAKVVVAGLQEARVQKEYPERPTSRATAVLKGEYSSLIKSTFIFILATLPFILVLMVGAGYFTDFRFGDSFNFVGDLGIGYPGGGDSISQSVASLYWDVNLPIFLMCAGAGVIALVFMAGILYVAKRAYFQDFYKQYIKTFFLGIKKFGLQVFALGLFGILVGAGMGTSVFYILSEQALGTIVIGDYFVAVFAFLFGLPLLAVPMATMSLMVVYNLKLKDAIKDAIVLIANRPLSTLLVGGLSAVPLLCMLLEGFIAVVIFIVMAMVGFQLVALQWIAYANGGMNVLKSLDAKAHKAIMSNKGAKGTHSKSANNKAKQEIIYGTVEKKKKKPVQQPYQNPKKKKKNK